MHNACLALSRGSPISQSDHGHDLLRQNSAQAEHRRCWVLYSEKCPCPEVTEAKSDHAQGGGGPQPEIAHAQGLLSQKVPMP